MEAPEKIYLYANPITDEPDDRWLSKRSDDNDIEYTRTDAFMKKAVNFIRECFVFKDDKPWHLGGEQTLKDKAIEEFEKYMKE